MPRAGMRVACVLNCDKVPPADSLRRARRQRKPQTKSTEWAIYCMPFAYRGDPGPRRRRRGAPRNKSHAELPADPAARRRRPQELRSLARARRARRCPPGLPRVDRAARVAGGIFAARRRVHRGARAAARADRRRAVRAREEVRRPAAAAEGLRDRRVRAGLRPVDHARPRLPRLLRARSRSAAPTSSARRRCSRSARSIASASS